MLDKPFCIMSNALAGESACTHFCVAHSDSTVYTLSWHGMSWHVMSWHVMTSCLLLYCYSPAPGVLMCSTV